MTVVQFNKAGKNSVSQNLDEDCFETFFAMFSASEQLTLGLLMGRKTQDGQTVFKDVQLEAMQNCASLTLRFDAADMNPYMHIDKIRAGESYFYKLRRENMAEQIATSLNDIYDIARDDINMMLGELAFDSKHSTDETVPHLRLVE